MASRISKFSLQQLRAFARLQNSDITINSTVGIQSTIQRQKELGDDPRSNADATILYKGASDITEAFAQKLHYFGSGNVWTSAGSTNFVTSGSGYLLGIPLSAGLTSKVGVLLKGIIKLAAADFGNPSGTAYTGAPIYISLSTEHYTFTAPSTSGNIVRILGYCVDISDDATAITMYFNPDKTWVEV